MDFVRITSSTHAKVELLTQRVARPLLFECRGAGGGLREYGVGGLGPLLFECGRRRGCDLFLRCAYYE